MVDITKLEDDDILTPEILEALGFKEDGTDHIDRPIYRKVSQAERGEDRTTEEWYPFVLQMQLHDYGEDNPNSGILSIHSPFEEAHGVPPHLYDKEEWTEQDHKDAEGYRIPLEEWTQPVAWHVFRLGRLKDLYKSLTRYDLIKTN